MTINLPPTVESSIREAVLSGQYASLDDAMAEAARLLLERLQSRPANRQADGMAAIPPPGKALTPDDVHRKMLADGLLSQLPDDAQDIDDDQDDEPVVIEGEPLSETIIRERR